MALNPQQQLKLRAALDFTTERFFAARKPGLILANGGTTGAKLDATGILQVLSQWAGDLIAGAPEDMRDDLFMAFADAVVTRAGIKEEEPETETAP